MTADATRTADSGDTSGKVLFSVIAGVWSARRRGERETEVGERRRGEAEGLREVVKEVKRRESGKVKRKAGQAKGRRRGEEKEASRRKMEAEDQEEITRTRRRTTKTRTRRKEQERGKGGQ